MDTPINVFSDWAQNGKDEGMEKHHNKSVMSMIDFACNGLPEYSFIDAGCGNGWVVRHISKDDRCCRAIGVDGSLNMIKKAKRLDNKNKYYSISNKKSYTIKEVARLFNSKIKYLPFRKGERFASALTNISSKNKILKHFGKIQLKDYIRDFINKNKKNN